MIPQLQLPVTRYGFRFRALDPIHLPPYAGFALRGVMGKALRQAVCKTGAPDCKGCPFHRECVYIQLFKTPPMDPAERDLLTGETPPNPYVLEPPALGTALIAPGDLLCFELVLIGRARDKLPLFVQALQSAFDIGVGHAKLRGRARLESVLLQIPHLNIPLWDPWQQRLSAHPEVDLELPPRLPGSHAHLRLLTPMGLKHAQSILSPRQINARALITSITRRATLLFLHHANLRNLVQDPKGLADHATTIHEERKLHWLGTRRFSSRQRRQIPLDGVLGEWTLHGDLTALAPWLWLGQWLHVGKSAVMGLGRYELTLST